MASWTYLLPSIDFETTTTAIPFCKGQHPYESVAYQFSHHEMKEDGSYTHNVSAVLEQRVNCKKALYLGVPARHIDAFRTSIGAGEIL